MLTDRAGQVGLVVKPHRFWPTVIALVTASPVYHVVIDLGDGTCIGAEPGGARIRDLSEFPDVIYSQFDYTKEERDDVLAEARWFKGREYNYLDDFLIGVAILLGEETTPYWLARRIQNLDSVQCAQLADICLTRAGIHVFEDNRVPAAVLPKSYVKYWVKKGWWNK